MWHLKTRWLNYFFYKSRHSEARVFMNDNYISPGLGATSYVPQDDIVFQLLAFVVHVAPAQI